MFRKKKKKPAEEEPEISRATEGVPEGETDLPDLTKTVQLVQQFKEGDDHALNEIFRRYSPRLRRVVRIKMGTQLRQHLDPEDIVQDTLVVALEKLSDLEIRSPASVMQWLTKVAENQIRNKVSYLQAQKRDPKRERRLSTGGDSSTDLTSSSIIVPHRGPTPSQILSRTELEELIDSCMEELEPQDYREVILMRDYYGAEWETIRVQMGRPTVDAARELHRRAHDKLQEKLFRRGWR